MKKFIVLISNNVDSLIYVYQFYIYLVQLSISL